MGYTALLFCPEEKTARTVTQVLSELEFTIEACSEPFAAVKKLMGQHFDAVVVDCDNEQNATLLFKSARNSASNQTSLAVAVVEGQAGVAKAFRIGANLVLTKPINIEQAKGTLRVARGLLRKSEPAKGGISPVTPAASPAKAAAPKPVSEPARSAEQKPGGVFAAQAAEPLEVKPTPAWPANAVASAKTASDDDLLDIEDKPEIKPAATAAPNPDAPILPSEIFAARSDARPVFAGSPTAPTSGAASAPAPAREVKEIAAPEKRRASDSDDDVLESGAGTAASGSIVGSAPSFTFGGTNVEAESSGGSKKIIFGIAAAAIVATGLYFGWSHFHGSAEQPSSPQAPVSTEAPISQPVKPSAHPAASKPSPAAPSSAPISESTPSKELSRQNADENGGAAPQTKSVSTEVKSDVEETVEPAPLMVKGGKVPAKHTKAAADAPAPSLIGMDSGEAVPPPNFAATDATFKPTLQTLNVSQGVSQGLLIKKVPPSYPPSALRMRIEGDVELVATIAKTGEITHVKVLSGDSQLTKAATDAVKQWKYKPYLLNGEPVEIQTQVTVRFKLPQ